MQKHLHRLILKRYLCSPVPHIHTPWNQNQITCAQGRYSNALWCRKLSEMMDKDKLNETVIIITLLVLSFFLEHQRIVIWVTHFGHCGERNNYKCRGFMLILVIWLISCQSWGSDFGKISGTESMVSDNTVTMADTLQSLSRTIHTLPFQLSSRLHLKGCTCIGIIICSIIPEPY